MLSERIRELANANGIDALGITDASVFTDFALKNSKRRDPKLSLADAKTIIIAGIYIGGLTLPIWTNPQYGRTSRLYLSGFFSDVVKPLELIKSFESPLSTQLTLSFQKEIEKWNKYFYLPDLVDLTKEKYKEVFGALKLILLMLCFTGMY